MRSGEEGGRGLGRGLKLGKALGGLAHSWEGGRVVKGDVLGERVRGGRRDVVVEVVWVCAFVALRVEGRGRGGHEGKQGLGDVSGKGGGWPGYYGDAVEVSF